MNKILKNSLASLFYELIRFGVIGAFATGAHFFIALTIAKTTDASLLICNVIAFSIAFVISFLGHFFITFKNSKGLKQSFVKFLCVALSGLALSSLTLTVLIRLGIESDVLKLAISIFIIPIFTYILGKKWAFVGETI